VVALLASHPLVLEGMANALASNTFQVLPLRVEPGPTLDAALKALPPAAIYILDLALAGSEPHALLAELLAHVGNGRVVLVDERMSDEDALELMRRGARGFVSFSNFKAQLPAAVETVASGGIWAPRALIVRALDAVLNTRQAAENVSDAVALSRREREVRDALMLNLSNKEIAEQLHISERTVKFHVSNLLAKFQVRRRADLILLTLQSPRRIG